MSDVVIPEVGEVGMEVTFVGWLKSEGEQVSVGEPIFEVDTGKVTLEIEAYVEGVLVDLVARPGDVLTSRQVVARILAPGEVDSPSTPGVGVDSSAVPTPVSSNEPVAPATPERGPALPGAGVAMPACVTASPRARRRAAEAGIDLASITDSGANRMISERDVEMAIARRTGGQMGIRELSVETTRRIQAIDITDLVSAHDLRDGFVWIGCPHTTAGVLIGESDPDMLADYERVAAELFAPFEPFRHHKNDSANAAAHLVSSFVGGQLLLPVVDGRLALGTYQRVIFLELDGPKARRTVQLAGFPALPPFATEQGT